MVNNSISSSNGTILDLLNGQAGSGQNKEGIALKAFLLNIAVSLGLFAFELSGFFLLKSSAMGRRIYQPKTYLVQDRLRVETVPANPIKWIRRIFNIEDEELKTKCGLDGYFFIRLLRALIIIFVPLMAIIVTILLPINYNGGKDSGVFVVGGKPVAANVTGLDTLSWQNVAPTQTNRYWAHLVCAVLAICWTLYRMYREKLNFIDVRQRFLTSPEHRLKASARTVLITNIPREYRSKEALEALYDVFVDNDDRSKLTVWVNRDYGPLRALVARRRNLRQALEKEELRIIRLVNKNYQKLGEFKARKRTTEDTSQDSLSPGDENEAHTEHDDQNISIAYEKDCNGEVHLWHQYLKPSTASQISLIQGKDGNWKPASPFKVWASGMKKKVPRIAWLRAEVARLTVQIEDLMPKLDDEDRFKKQNSAFIQFDRQMAAHMACSLASHNKAGRMSPRFLEVAPHEIIWPNMNVTSLGRMIRTCIALVLFVAMLFLWGIPTTILASISQLGNLRTSVTWLAWLRPWPSWVISLISGPLTSILLALLIQLVVPALLRKLAVLVGAPTRSKREVVTQDFYFTFLFIELVLLTAISSGIVNVIPEIVNHPTNIPTILATDLPKSANYFFNYLVVQSLGFSGSVLFQYLRLLYITTIWPWFTQTPRQEAWLQTTIPHQMWGNVYSLTTNFAVIVRNTQNDVACSSQAIIMIVVLVLTAVFHFVMEQNLRPLYEFLPVALEDSAVDAERQRFLVHNDNEPVHDEAGERDGIELSNLDSVGAMDGNTEQTMKRRASRVQMKTMSATAAHARKALSRLKQETAAKVTEIQAHVPEPIDRSRRRQVADQLAAAIAGYSDELTDLSPEEREAELKAAFQDPVTREPAPVIWIPQDPAGISEDAIKQANKYGQYLQYSSAGAYLTTKNKCEVTQPAPDVRPDWLLEWML
ncbi:calcium permeable stress-gated cation channel, partial [Lecanoromycetidae sp. Uapishka_2]